MSTTRKTHYEILNVKPSATLKQIKKKYRKLALKNHPDKTAKKDSAAREEAEEYIKQLNEAYRILSDEHRRAAYDLSLTEDGEQHSDPLARDVQRMVARATKTTKTTKPKESYKPNTRPLSPIDFSSIPLFDDPLFSMLDGADTDSDDEKDDKAFTTRKPEPTPAIKKDAPELAQTYEKISTEITTLLSSENVHYQQLKIDFDALQQILIENNLFTSENIDTLNHIDLKNHPESFSTIGNIIKLIHSYDKEPITQDTFNKILSFQKMPVPTEKAKLPPGYSTSSSSSTPSSALSLYEKYSNDVVIVVETNLLSDLYQILLFVKNHNLLDSTVFNQIIALKRWIVTLYSIFNLLKNTKITIETDFYKKLLLIEASNFEKLEEIDNILVCITKKFGELSSAFSEEKIFTVTESLKNRFSTDHIKKTFYSRLLTNMLRENVSHENIKILGLAINEFRLKERELDNYLLFHGWHYILIMSEHPDALVVAAGIMASRNGEFHYFHKLTEPAYTIYLENTCEQTSELEFIFSVYHTFGSKYKSGHSPYPLDYGYLILRDEYAKNKDKITASAESGESMALTILLKNELSVIGKKEENLPLVLRKKGSSVEIPAVFDPKDEARYGLYNAVGDSHAGEEYHSYFITQTHEEAIAGYQAFAEQERKNSQQEAHSTTETPGIKIPFKDTRPPPVEIPLDFVEFSPPKTGNLIYKAQPIKSKDYISYTEIKELDSKLKHSSPERESIYNALRAIDIDPATKPAEAYQILIISTRIMKQYYSNIMSTPEFKQDAQLTMKNTLVLMLDYNNAIIKIAELFSRRCKELSSAGHLSEFDRDDLLDLQSQFEHEKILKEKQNKNIGQLPQDTIDEGNFRTLVTPKKKALPAKLPDFIPEEKALFNELISPDLDMEYLTSINALVEKVLGKEKNKHETGSDTIDIEESHRRIMLMESIYKKIGAKLSYIKSDKSIKIANLSSNGLMGKKRKEVDQPAPAIPQFSLSSNFFVEKRSKIGR